jgi:hypothetical protein
MYCLVNYLGRRVLILVNKGCYVESAKECVTTHLPNELALKMDGAEAGHLYSTTSVNVWR